MGGHADFGSLKEREAILVAPILPKRSVHIALLFLMAEVKEDSDLL